MNSRGARGAAALFSIMLFFAGLSSYAAVVDSPLLRALGCEIHLRNADAGFWRETATATLSWVLREQRALGAESAKLSDYNETLYRGIELLEREHLPWGNDPELTAAWENWISEGIRAPAAVRVREHLWNDLVLFGRSGEEDHYFRVLRVLIGAYGRPVLESLVAESDGRGASGPYRTTEATIRERSSASTGVRATTDLFDHDSVIGRCRALAARSMPNQLHWEIDNYPAPNYFARVLATPTGITRAVLFSFRENWSYDTRRSRWPAPWDCLFARLSRARSWEP